MPAKWNGTQFKQITHKKAIDFLEYAGSYVEGEAKQLVPVDTGHLKSSIHHIVNKSQYWTKIGSNVKYASPVEFGTWASRVPPFDTHTKGMKPRPYLRPALDKFRQKMRAL